MEYGLLLAQALILTTFLTLSGRSLAAARLNIPPILAPTSVIFCCPTNSSTSLHCARTISPKVTIGNRVAHRSPVFVSITLLGPVEPKQPPRTFVHTTKYLFVSSALLGPINFSHHPGLGLSSFEAACEDAERPVKSRRRLSFLSFNLPHVS
jgi:hypothetical protein